MAFVYESSPLQLWSFEVSANEDGTINANYSFRHQAQDGLHHQPGTPLVSEAADDVVGLVTNGRTDLQAELEAVHSGVQYTFA